MNFNNMSADAIRKHVDELTKRVAFINGLIAQAKKLSDGEEVADQRERLAEVRSQLERAEAALDAAPLQGVLYIGTETFKCTFKPFESKADELEGAITFQMGGEDEPAAETDRSTTLSVTLPRAWPERPNAAIAAAIKDLAGGAQ